MDKTFESLINSMPIIKEMYGGNAAFTICDREKCLYASDGESIKAPMQTGSNIDDKLEVMQAVYREKKTINRTLNKESYGVDIKVTLIPIFNDKNQVIGSMGLSFSTEKFAQIQNSTEELMSSLQETSATIADITSGAAALSEKLNTLVDNTKETEKLIKESSEAVNLIESISKQSNLLGLNAAIESSRAGEYGKGFSVVAGEMRKLALNSGESSKRISKALVEMSSSMKVILDAINELGEIATNQAASLEEVSASVEQITVNSQVLVDNTKIE